MKSLIRLLTWLFAAHAVAAGGFRSLSPFREEELAPIEQALAQHPKPAGTLELYLLDTDGHGRVRVRSAVDLGPIDQLDPTVVHESPQFELTVEAEVKSVRGDSITVEFILFYGKAVTADRIARGVPPQAPRETSKTTISALGVLSAPVAPGLATTLKASRGIHPETEETNPPSGPMPRFVLFAYLHP